jgi:hypothetical protein
MARPTKAPSRTGATRGADMNAIHSDLIGLSAPGAADPLYSLTPKCSRPKKALSWRDNCPSEGSTKMPFAGMTK